MLPLLKGYFYSPTESCLKTVAGNHLRVMILTAVAHLNRTRLQLIGQVNPLNTQNNPEQARVGMQCQRTDPVNYDKVTSSQEQTATQLNTRVGGDLGSPDQTVTQSEDMRPETGPEGKQNPQKTLNTKILFAISEHLLVHYIRVCKGHKDIRTLRVISNIYFI